MFGENKIVMDFKLQNQYNMLIFYLDKNYELSIYMLFNFNEEKYISHYFEKCKINGLNNVIYSFKFDKNHSSQIIGQDTSYSRGIVYKMKYILSLQVNGNNSHSSAFLMNQSLDIKNINKLNVLSDTNKFTNNNNNQFFNQN